MIKQRNKKKENIESSYKYYKDKDDGNFTSSRTRAYF
jgi:hypothetical protein